MVSGEGADGGTAGRSVEPRLGQPGTVEGNGLRAAKDVRQWVSGDPGEDFARELATVAADERELAVNTREANYAKD